MKINCKNFSGTVKYVIHENVKLSPLHIMSFYGGR